MENKNNKKGFSLLEMIMVIIIAGIIYRTVAENLANSLDSARKMAFLSKIEKSSLLACNAYKSDRRISGDRNEYFNQYDPSVPLYHNSNYDIINPNDYNTDIDQSILIKTPQGFTDGANTNNIVYKYRNGECLTEVYLSKLLYQSKNFIENTYKTNVVDAGTNWFVTFITFDGDGNNHKLKHILNVRNNTYRDRRDEGTFNTTSLSGRNIQNMTGFVKNNTLGETTFWNADAFNEVNDSPNNNSYLYHPDDDGNPSTLNTLGSNRIDDDPYDTNLTKPVRFNNNAHTLSKDGVSPLRNRENNLLIKRTRTNANKNGYMSGQSDGYIPGGRGFITCKQNRSCIDNNVTPSVDTTGIKLVQP